MAEIYVGEVIHFFKDISVVVVTLVDQVNQGDIVRFKSPDRKKRGTRVDFEQEIESMEMESHPVLTAEPGWMVAIKVNQRLRPGDRVYKKTE